MPYQLPKLQYISIVKKLQGDPSRWPKPPVDSKQKFCFSLVWPGLSRPKRNFFVWKSMGGFGQRDVMGHPVQLLFARLSLQHSYHSIEAVHFFVDNAAILSINDLKQPVQDTVGMTFYRTV